MPSFKSIKTQITLATGIALLISIIVMVLVGFYSGNKLYKNISTKTEEYGQQWVSSDLEKIASDVEKVSRLISSNVQLANDIANTQAFLKQHALVNQIDRDKFSQYLKHLLITNPDIGGTYVVWEPNAVDGRDANFEQNNQHSDHKGQYAPYWARSRDGSLNLRPSNMDLVYNDNTTNAQGLRPGEWYLCPFEKQQTCISDPAYWDIKGVPTLMTSITTPIIVDGDVIGVAGVDLSVSFIQTLAEQVNASLFNGAGQLEIISTNGSTVANTANPDAIGKPIEPKRWQQIEPAVKRSDSYVQQGNDEITALVPLTFTSSPMAWAVQISVPLNIAMAQTNNMNDFIDNQFSNSLLSQLIIGLIVGFAGFIVVWVISGRITSPVRKVSSLISDLSESEGDLTQRINIKLSNEVGALSNDLDLFLDKTHNIIKDASDSANRLETTASLSKTISHQTDQSVSAQKTKLKEVSNAIYNMSQSSNDMTHNCLEASKSAEHVSQQIKLSASIVDVSLESLSQLTEKMQNASSDINALETATQNINSILEVIRGISEQTNLLALNAAIEAARAGDHGRGFAIVADEVRNLAVRTQQSTEEIDQIMHVLRNSAANAIQTMRDGTSMCEENKTRATESKSQLDDAVNAAQTINQATANISRSVDQQTTTTEVISRNIHNIHDALNQVSNYASEANNHSQHVDQIVVELKNQINKFKY